MKFLSRLLYYHFLTALLIRHHCIFTLRALNILSLSNVEVFLTIPNFLPIDAHFILMGSPEYVV